MSVDKFGRHSSINDVIQGPRGPKGEGIHFTKEANYNMQGKRLCFVGSPIDSHDAVNLSSLSNYTLVKNNNVYDAKKSIIKNVGKPIRVHDAATAQYVLELLIELGYVIYSQINKKKKKRMDKSEWKRIIFSQKPWNWEDLFKIHEEEDKPSNTSSHTTQPQL